MKSIRFFPVFLFVALLCVLAWSIIQANNDPASIILPPGFTATTVVEELEQPIDMLFLPSGDLFVLEKGSGENPAGVANIFLIKGDEIQSRAVLQLDVNPDENRGALAMALHPDFATNGYFYVSYIIAVNPNTAEPWPTTLRVSRFQYDHAIEAAVADSERILLEVAADHPVTRHHGNSLVFDHDGNLYIGVGDFDFEEIGTPQVTTERIGKILRVRPTIDDNAPYYTIPADNPFVNNPSYLPEIYAIGTRNPYRMALRQSDGLIAIGDVGRSDWEEINVMQSGVNYGWPVREGPCHIGGRKPCLPATAEYTDPALYYEHEWFEALGRARSGAVTGLAFYEDDIFPADFQGNLVFTDFALGFMGVADLQTGTYKRFAENLTAPVDLEVHDGVIYLLDIELGSIIAIRYANNNNQAPIASFAADNTFGAAPHTVTFAADALDPDGNPLTYIYDFGDGNVITTTDTVVQHTYLSDQTVTARLTVVDSLGAAALQRTQQVTVYSGVLPDIVLTNQTSISATDYRGGYLYGYDAVITDTTNLAGEPFRWDILLHHGAHIHPQVSGYVGQNNFFTIPTENHDGEHNLWYEWVLSMTTADGQVIRLSEAIYPETMEMTFQSNPLNAPISVNGVVVTGTTTITAIVGVDNHLIALPNTVNGSTWFGTAWSAGNAGAVGGDTMIRALPAYPVWTAAYIPAAATLYLPVLANGN